ncbi:hypothetical protein ACUN24_09075 [Pedobacter sp. WC2501]|uniref:hypothetical protein n=1 Tax=Pedobacter sp. WC2501 TaxID=3461400 RepID=UPI00404591E8
MRVLSKCVILIIVTFYHYNAFAQDDKKKPFSLDSIRQDSVKHTLNEINIVSRNPISEKFSVVKVDKLDIYFNPMSNADPLKAITILPASTNTSETANPTLRGGDADRSRVFINGAPILNPVRNGQDNGLGNFSLFNTELIDNQYVYASNPPLTFGNSSAGIVQIETNKSLLQENLQLSLSLSNAGLLMNKKLSRNSFIQFYGNHQFSNLFLNLNKNNLPNLHDFSTNDLGINLHIALSEKASINSYNYFIDEWYKSQNYQLNFSDSASAKQKRFFSINSFDYIKRKSVFKISTLVDVSNQNYNFGVINSDTKYFQFFLTASHKYYLSNKATVQYGLDYSISRYNYDEIRPIYFFSLQNNSKIYPNKEVSVLQYLEPYLYFNYDVLNNLGFSLAARKNVPLQNQQSFTSYQLAMHYEIDKRNRFILSMGNYHSYKTPNYISHEISLLSSKQLALDYYYTIKKLRLTSAIYYKEDAGDFVVSQIESFNSKNTFGLEFSLNYDINNRFSIGFSNLYVNQNMYAGAEKYKSNLNLKYYIKSQVSYLNPGLFTASLAFSTRPGNFYTALQDKVFNIDANSYEPIFGDLNNASFKSYSKLDFTINKSFQMRKNGLITYLSINNLLNTKNEATINYSKDYSAHFFNYYQQRIIYFGAQYRLLLSSRNHHKIN